MMYCKEVWEEIGKTIGWCSFTAALSYFRYLDKKEDKVRFLPQPADIEKLMKERFADRKINDEHGWTGEWRMSAKDILDLIIDMQNSEEK